MDPKWEDDLQGEAERNLWAALRGRSLEYVEIGPNDPSAGASWGPDRAIRASFIKAIALGEATYSPSILRVRGARITGELDFEASRAVCPLDFDGCYFDEAINFEQFEASAIYLTRCNIPAGIKGSQLHTHHNFYLDGSSFSAEVCLKSARIDGQLGLEGAHLRQGSSLVAGAITVGQGAYFSGMRAEGRIHFGGAQITAKFDMRGAQLAGSASGEALYAPRIQVHGNLLLERNFTAEGTVDLTNATISGDLKCSGGHFKKGSIGETMERCLDLARVEVGQHIYLSDGFSATGTVYLADAVIGGTLNCEGGTFDNPADTAIYAPGIKVGRDVMLTKSTAAPALDQSGFMARGKVVLSGAQINAKLDFSGGRFLSSGEREESLLGRGMRVGSLIFDNNFLCQGLVDIRRTTIEGELRGISAVDPRKIKIAGMAYRSTGDTDDAEAQIAWLVQVTYSSQIYRQLASVYAAEGDEGAAKSVLIAGRESRRRSRKKPRRYKRYTELPLKWFVNYGYSPFRVLIWLGFFELIGGVIFIALSDDMTLAPLYKGSSVSAEGSSMSSWHPEFQPWIYTADLLLPVVDLQQNRFWIPTHAAEWLSAAFIIIGWTLATALVVGLGSVFRSDNRKDDWGPNR
ncbi:hypothetical protein ABT330_20485 [Streptomyces sp. NPDC000658]|uniref:hypothetical protein n=1 Tax=Streptomyces sp. NPDC000658 TaxID=3154266 RepID=UPI00332F0235